MTERLCQFTNRYRPAIDAALSSNLPYSAQPHASRLNDALHYALFPGGRRWRPMMTLLGAELVGARPGAAIPAACSMEFLHTSSIILDDLPAMDDAGQRRGRPSLHLVFGESVALLAALTLLNESYVLLMRSARDNGFYEAGAKLIEESARWIGSNGMIGGQAVDLLMRGSGLGESALVSRNLKTTGLMRLTLMSGALACGASDEDANVLADFGESFGAAYQICDDLLDELGASDELGKPVRQDSRHGRSNYVAELGFEVAHQLAVSIIEESERTLRQRFGDQPAVDLLADAANIILAGSGKLTLAVA